MGKSALWRIPADHFRTLNIFSRFKSDKWSIFCQLVLPFITGFITQWRGWTLKDVGDAVTGVSIVAGLLFSMAVLLFQLRTSIDADPRLEENDKDLIDQCMSNTLWAILWGFTLSLYLVVVGARDWINSSSSGPILTGVAAAATTHFIFVILMCLKRLRRAYERIAMQRR